MCNNASEAAMEKALMPRSNVQASGDTFSMETECEGDFFDLRSLAQPGWPVPQWSDHSGINRFYPELRGHLFTTLRQPEQRVMSGWHNAQHSWPTVKMQRDAYDVLEYAHVVAGCGVKMLMRDGMARSMSHGDHGLALCGGETFDSDGLKPAPSDTEVIGATQRLREGFAFVGILEKWVLTVCLLHTMYGGRCSASELGEPGTWYNTSALNGFIDTADGMLYAEGQRIFEQNVKLYALSKQDCERRCQE